MSGNTFGKIFKVTTFGESHGEALGVVIDGVPACLKIDEARIQAELDRRRPGKQFEGRKNLAVTSRNEEDRAEILSGVYNACTEGTPIAITIKNTSQKSKDYSNLAATFRPGHADISYFAKYAFRDYRGGGRASGRETAARVAAGAIARQFLENELKSDFNITAYTLRAAGVSCKKIDFSQIEQNPMRAPDNEAAALMEERLAASRNECNSVGGIIECQISGVPRGLGEPVFDKLDAELAKAMLSIGAVKGIEFGSGFAAADLTGTQNNDQMKCNGNEIEFLSENAGGILGGISNGQRIVFRIAVKPVASVFVEQQTVQAKINPDAPAENPVEYENTVLKIKGRHDVCLCPRIVPVVEAMAAITIADMYLQNLSAKIS